MLPLDELKLIIFKKLEVFLAFVSFDEASY